MSLTSTDLKNLTSIVHGEVVASESHLKTKLEGIEARLDIRIKRVESSLITAMSMRQRDLFERLDEHDARLARLEHTRRA